MQVLSALLTWSTLMTNRKNYSRGEGNTHCSVLAFELRSQSDSQSLKSL